MTTIIIYFFFKQKEEIKNSLPLGKVLLNQKIPDCVGNSTMMNIFKHSIFPISAQLVKRGVWWVGHFHFMVEPMQFQISSQFHICVYSCL